MKTGAIARLARSLAALAASLTLAITPAFGEVTTESELKAAYLINFLKYVEWPGTRTTVNLCLFGRDSVGPYLAAYEGRQIGGRELRIRKVSTPEQLAECQELFIPETEEARFAAVLRWADGKAILTVSDAESFTRDGGAIALIRAEGRLQFDVNAEALARAGLRGSPQMLRLARQIIGATH
ncbi:MAG: YfiR family protein [Azonexaceae bacterium]|nr:YfiR family protein [Azonexaceae bacterium]